jgi:hypothetical protein
MCGAQSPTIREVDTGQRLEGSEINTLSVHAEFEVFSLLQFLRTGEIDNCWRQAGFERWVVDFPILPNRTLISNVNG